MLGCHLNRVKEEVILPWLPASEVCACLGGHGNSGGCWGGPVVWIGCFLLPLAGFEHLISFAIAFFCVWRNSWNLMLLCLFMTLLSGVTLASGIQLMHHLHQILLTDRPFCPSLKPDSPHCLQRFQYTPQPGEGLIHLSLYPRKPQYSLNHSWSFIWMVFRLFCGLALAMAKKCGRDDKG